MGAQGNAKGESRQEADDVRDVCHVRVIAMNQARVGDDNDVVNEIDERHQTLGREKQPGKLEWFDEHHASSQGKDGRRGAQRSRPARHEGRAEDETDESTGEEDDQVIARADGLLQGVSKDK